MHLFILKKSRKDTHAHTHTHTVTVLPERLLATVMHGSLCWRIIVPLPVVTVQAATLSRCACVNTSVYVPMCEEPVILTWFITPLIQTCVRQAETSCSWTPLLFQTLKVLFSPAAPIGNACSVGLQHVHKGHDHLKRLALIIHTRHTIHLYCISTLWCYKNHFE